MKNIVQIGFYHDLYLGIFSMIKAYSMGKKHPCFFFFCCWCDWGSGEESSLKMKVAHVFSGGSASRIFHETSLSLVKIPRPAPPPHILGQNLSEFRWDSMSPAKQVILLEIGFTRSPSADLRESLGQVTENTFSGQISLFKVQNSTFCRF